MTLTSSCRLSSITVVAAALLIITATTTAQTSQEFKSAADALLQREQLEIDFKSATGWSSTFRTNVKARTTEFVGSSDQFCLGNKVPTEILFVENSLILEFKPRTGCSQIQYRFNPVTGSGVVFSGAAGGPLTPTQAKISIRK